MSPVLIPAARAISGTLVPWKPLRLKRSRAAVVISSRRSSRASFAPMCTRPSLHVYVRAVVHGASEIVLLQMYHILNEYSIGNQQGISPNFRSLICCLPSHPSLPVQAPSSHVRRSVEDG